MPYCEPLGDAPDAADVQAVETGDEAEFGVVGHLDPQKPPAPIAHPLFRLFYQVEIRHRQLLQKQKAPLAGRRPCNDTMRLWRFYSCRIHKFLRLSRLASEPWLQPGAPPPILANTKPIVYAIIG
jgi:hypothetical protein